MKPARPPATLGCSPASAQGLSWLSLFVLGATLSAMICVCTIARVCECLLACTLSHVSEVETCASLIWQLYVTQATLRVKGSGQPCVPGPHAVCAQEQAYGLHGMLANPICVAQLMHGQPGQPQQPQQCGTSKHSSTGMRARWRACRSHLCGVA